MCNYEFVKDIGMNIFSIIADEYTDISNKEQLKLCFQWTNDSVEINEDFLDYYNIPNVNSDTTDSVIKDTFARLQLSRSNCRGQCYDGASNMLGCKTGVATQLKDIQPKAYIIHCHGHSLILSI